jgi:hypothetical protein
MEYYTGGFLPLAERTLRSVVTAHNQSPAPPRRGFGFLCQVNWDKKSTPNRMAVMEAQIPLAA